MSDIAERRVRLAPTSLDQLDAYFRDPAELAEALRSPLPEGWPHDVNVFLWVANALQAAPDTEQVMMWWVLDAEDGRLVGDGGFRATSDGAVELIYEIADEMVGHGYASQTVAALCRIAFLDAAVLRVDSHTRIGDTTSEVVLRKSGFAPRNEVLRDDAAAHADAAQGTAWSLLRA